MKTHNNIEHPYPKTYRPKRSCRQIAILLLASAMIVTLLLVVCALALQVVAVTTPFRNQDIGALSGLPHQEVTLTTADGLQISGWYIPGRRSQAIILVHGIHANRAFLIPQAHLLAQAGYPLLMIDLRGHGLSQGHELTYGYREALDVQAAVDYLLSRPEIEKVGAFGHSLGGAAVVQAAARDERLQAIVVQSSYSSLSLATEEAYETFTVLPRWPFASLIISLSQLRLGMNLDQVNSATALAAMPPRPVLIIHGAEDTLFRPHHAQMMFDSAPEPKSLFMVEGVGHNNPIFGHEAEYNSRLLNFFDEALR
jgi:fermentation-respiration switch protein FrsA (DUF1100 family)